jgi:hypothetical protein
MNWDLEAFFSDLSDDELLSRVRRGLTDEALAIATHELSIRNLEPLPSESMPAFKEPYLGDMVILERDLDPTEAHMLCACLRSAGIEADAGDTNLVQTNSLLTIAVGGAKVRVPETQLEDARRIVQAFRRGDFELDDDFDVGQSRG